MLSRLSLTVNLLRHEQARMSGPVSCGILGVRAQTLPDNFDLYRFSRTGTVNSQCNKTANPSIQGKKVTRN